MSTAPRTREPDPDLKTRPYLEVLTDVLPAHNTKPRPDNIYQALLETAPFQEPEISAEELDVDAPTPALDSLDVLTELERAIIEGWVFQRQTLQAMADEHGLSHRYQASRIRDRALGKLEAHITEGTNK